MKYLNIFLLIGLFSLPSFADTEIGFDEIVEDLSRSRTSSRSSHSSNRSIEDVEIHVGIGVTNGVFSIQHPDGSNTQASQRGFQANLGIDLFNPKIVAEGGIMSYLEREYDHASIALQEFNLKIYYKDYLEEQLAYRLGGGLAARYMTVTTKTYGEEKYSTPAWLAIIGMDIYLTKGLSLGGEVAGRGSLTNETPDQSSVDFALRLDAHF